jgi:hypothetical protein
MNLRILFSITEWGWYPPLVGKDDEGLAHCGGTGRDSGALASIFYLGLLCGQYRIVGIVGTDGAMGSGGFTIPLAFDRGLFCGGQ